MVFVFDLLLFILLHAERFVNMLVLTRRLAGSPSARENHSDFSCRLGSRSAATAMAAAPWKRPMESYAQPAVKMLIFSC